MFAPPSTGLLEYRTARDQNAERNSDEDRESDGRPDQPKVFGGEFQILRCDSVTMKCKTFMMGLDE